MFKFSYPATIKVFATPGSDGLAQEICKAMQPRLPRQFIPYENGQLKLGDVNLKVFGNENVEAQVENVRDVFAVVINSQVPPVAEHFVDLLALLDALVNANVGDILLVLPYMTFSRSDRKDKPRISTMGKLFAKIINEACNVRRVLLLDPHDGHLKHYFDPAANEISAFFLFTDYIERTFFATGKESRNDWVIVFADSGAAKKYKRMPYLLKLLSAYIDKERSEDSDLPQPVRVVGDVNQKNCLVVDDEILSGGTAITDTIELQKVGAKRIVFVAPHAVLADEKLSVPEVVQRLENSLIEEFIIGDSIPVRHKLLLNSKFIVISLVPLLAEAISRVVQGESLTELHKPENVNLYRSF